MHFTEIIAILALGFCALIGLGALFSPNWAAGVVRLVEDPNPDKPGGYSEFRATYGGLLFFLHLMAIVIFMMLAKSPAPETQFAALLVVLPIAFGWFGAGFGRSLSFILDKKRNRGAGMIPTWIGVEFALGLAILSPILQFMS